MPRRLKSPYRSPAVVIVGILVVGNALARGGVDLPTVAGSAALAVAAVWAALRRGRRRSDTVSEDGAARLPVLAIGLAVLALAVGLQLVPVPPAVVRLLSPGAADLFQRQLGPIGAWPAARPLSLDPGGTALELAKSCAWACVAAASAIVAADRSRRDALLAIVALGGPLVVAAMWAARLFANAPLLEPRFPFVNPNHLAGFLQLAAWPALGFALRARGPARLGWLGAFVLSASGIFLSLSRGGIGAFVVGGGIFVALYMRAGTRRRTGDTEASGAPRAGAPQRDASRDETAAHVVWARVRALARRSWARSSALVPIAVSAALGLAAFFAFDRIVSELRTVSEASTTEVKLGLWPLAVSVIRDFPVAGIGRGAFATVFPAYKWEPILATFTHVENEWLQLPVDMGLPVGLAALALFAWAFVAQARRAEISRPVIGALAGAGALAAHSCFDFSLEIGGVAIPFAVVMGIAAREMPLVRAPAWAVRAAAALALLLAAAGVWVHHAHRPETDAARVASAPSADEALVLAREALPWHPADWVTPAAVATKLAGELRCDEAEPWLERAIQRNPTAPETHRGAARCYAIRGKGSLARRSYRLAFILGDRDALAEANELFPGELLEIAPDTPAGLLAAGWLLRSEPAQAREAWRRCWESFRDARALAELARVTLDLGETAAAVDLAYELQAAAPLDPSGYVVAARALLAMEDEDGAQHELELGVGRFPGRMEVLEALGYLQLKNRRFSQARTTFDQIVARDDRTVARKKLLVALALEGQGRYGEALRLLREARDTVPNDVAPLETLGRVAAKAGRYDDALQALETAAHKPGVAPGQYDEAMSRIRTARTTAWVKGTDPAPAK